jgi:hypothetical protein
VDLRVRFEESEEETLQMVADEEEVDASPDVDTEAGTAITERELFGDVEGEDIDTTPPPPDYPPPPRAGVLRPTPKSQPRPAVRGQRPLPQWLEESDHPVFLYAGGPARWYRHRTAILQRNFGKSQKNITTTTTPHHRTFNRAFVLMLEETLTAAPWFHQAPLAPPHYVAVYHSGQRPGDHRWQLHHLPEDF